MMELRIRSFTDSEGAPSGALNSRTVGDLIDSIREELTRQYHETGTLPGIGYMEFLAEDGKLYVVWLDPVVVEVDETTSVNPFIESMFIYTCEKCGAQFESDDLIGLEYCPKCGTELTTQ